MNQYQFSQPHVRAKLARSGALGTVEMAKMRANLPATLEALTLSAMTIMDNVGLYLESDTLARVSILAMHCEKQTMAAFGKKSPYRAQAVRMIELVNQASYRVGLAQVRLARSLPPIGAIIFRTRGMVNMITSGVGC